MSLLADGATTVKIKAALIADERVSAASINVDTRNGVVWLLGSVCNAAERDRTEAVALDRGARQLVNLLALEVAVPDADSGSPRIVLPADFGRTTAAPGAPPPPALSPEDMVHAVLVADRRVNAHLVVVRVENGVVHLSGRQDTVQARAAAAESAARVPGIVSVRNDLEVRSSV